MFSAASAAKYEGTRVSDISFEWEMSGEQTVRNRWVSCGRMPWEPHTLASEEPKTFTSLTCNSWLCAAPGEATQEPVSRTAAPTVRLQMSESAR